MDFISDLSWQEQGFSFRHYLVECVYNPEVQTNEIERFFYDLSGTIKKEEANLNILAENAAEFGIGDGDTIRKLFREFYTGLMKYAPKFKHPKFYEEEEWRIVYLPTPGNKTIISYRDGGTMFIPYVELELGKEGQNPVDVVFVGPTPYMDLAITSAEGQISKIIGEDVFVTKSKIPYREQ